MRRLAMVLPISALLWWGLNVPQQLPMQPQTAVKAADTPIMPGVTKSTPRVRLATAQMIDEQLCPGRSHTSVADGVVCLVNEARQQHGLAPAQTNVALMTAAEAKGNDLAQCGFSHEACGRDFGYWIRQNGYPGGCSGENIAWNQRSAREVFVAWMNSPAHRDNILTADFRDIGIGVTTSSDGTFWTMLLGGC